MYVDMCVFNVCLNNVVLFLFMEFVVEDVLAFGLSNLVIDVKCFILVIDGCVSVEFEIM